MYIHLIYIINGGRNKEYSILNPTNITNVTVYLFGLFVTLSG